MIRKGDDKDQEDDEHDQEEDNNEKNQNLDPGSAFGIRIPDPDPEGCLIRIQWGSGSIPLQYSTESNPNRTSCKLNGP